MKLLLTVLFVLPIIQLSYSIGCATFIPGFDRLSRGIDVTLFELFPKDVTSSAGYTHPILDFKCDKHKKWNKKLKFF